MRLLVFLLVISLASLSHPAVSGDSFNPQHRHLISKYRILDKQLLKECQGYAAQKKNLAALESMKFEALKSEVEQMELRLLKCRSPTTVTTPTSLCPFYDGDSVFNIHLIGYKNPTNKKASGELCNPDGSPCTISLEICVSPIKSSSCEFHHQVIDLKTNDSNINLGNLFNPLKVNLGNRKWQGVHVLITAKNKNSLRNSRGNQVVDKLSYQLTDAQGSPYRLLVLRGARFTDKTELGVIFNIPCPTPAANLPTECVTATNLTQPWRFEQDGKYVRGSGHHSSEGYACDLYDMGWFRFTGAAGTHMLETCPSKSRSCGTFVRMWSDEIPPQAVGVKAKFNAYGVVDEKCKMISIPMQVMRCSLNTVHDLIYKYVGHFTSGTETCWNAFCGVR